MLWRIIQINARVGFIKRWKKAVSMRCCIMHCKKNHNYFRRKIVKRWQVRWRSDAGNQVTKGYCFTISSQFSLNSISDIIKILFQQERVGLNFFQRIFSQYLPLLPPCSFFNQVSLLHQSDLNAIVPILTINCTTDNMT